MMLSNWISLFSKTHDQEHVLEVSNNQIKDRLIANGAMQKGWFASKRLRMKSTDEVIRVLDACGVNIRTEHIILYDGHLDITNHKSKENALDVKLVHDIHNVGRLHLTGVQDTQKLFKF